MIYYIRNRVYYLNSRCYNSVWGRFINADGIVGANQDILSYNLYAYCSNNPVNCSDPSGMFVGDDIFNTWNTASKNMEKVTGQKGKTIPKKNVIEKIKDSFVFDAGVGFGANVGESKINGGYYNDKTIKIENGQVRKGNSIGLSAGVNLPSNQSVGLGKEYFHTGHYVPGNITESIKHSQPFPLIHDIKDCAEVTNSYSYKTSKNTKVEKSNSIFAGIDFDLHMVIGGHIKVGFNVPNNFGGIIISSMF